MPLFMILSAKDALLEKPHHAYKLGRMIWMVVLVFTTGLIIYAQWAGETTGLARANDFSKNLLALLVFCLISLAGARLLSPGKRKSSSAYKMAFFAVILIGLVLLLLTGTNRASLLGWRHITGILLGAFTGSFIASNQAMRWWENNAPPSTQVAQDVLVVHQEVLGTAVQRNLSKRLFDIAFSLFALLLSLPVWLLVILLIWWEDPGPILFVKNSVGRGGKNFKQFKFRSMILHAEKDTGPISGYENDERVLWFGRFLRKTALDEVPQLINILLGDMSTVGPRPQRTVLVHGYLQAMPVYARRHRVRPGLAGLAQVVDAYDISPEDKLAWDLLYIEKSNFWLDLKLLFAAFYLVFALRWLRETHPELRIRKMLDVAKSEARACLHTALTRRP
jgi:lipopolysaccharide/colanic/teichoic acid biosynthesis glycosyltransferase